MVTDKTPEECKALVDQGWTYLDVRTPDEFAGGHAPGAKNIPFALIGPGGMMPNPEFLAVVQRVFPKDAPLVVGCAAGGRSTRAIQMLSQAGYTRLVNVQGGFQGARDANGQVVARGWCDCGLPTTAGEDEGSYDQVRAGAGA